MTLTEEEQAAINGPPMPEQKQQASSNIPEKLQADSAISLDETTNDPESTIASEESAVDVLNDDTKQQLISSDEKSTINTPPDITAEDEKATEQEVAKVMQEEQEHIVNETAAKDIGFKIPGSKESLVDHEEDQIEEDDEEVKANKDVLSAAVEAVATVPREEKAIQHTLAIIKPDAFATNKTDDIVFKIKEAGFIIVQERQLHLSLEQACLFYREHEGKPFYNELTEWMSSGPIHAMILEKVDAIQDWRAKMGPTDPVKARDIAPNSIRALFGTDGMNNATHGSDCQTSAEREIQIIFETIEVPQQQQNKEEKEDNQMQQTASTDNESKKPADELQPTTVEKIADQQLQLPVEQLVEQTVTVEEQDEIKIENLTAVVDDNVDKEAENTTVAKNEAAEPVTREHGKVIETYTDEPHVAEDITEQPVTEDEEKQDDDVSLKEAIHQGSTAEKAPVVKNKEEMQGKQELPVKEENISNNDEQEFSSLVADKVEEVKNDDSASVQQKDETLADASVHNNDAEDKSEVSQIATTATTSEDISTEIEEPLVATQETKEDTIENNEIVDESIEEFNEKEETSKAAQGTGVIEFTENDEKISDKTVDETELQDNDITTTDELKGEVSDEKVNTQPQQLKELTLSQTSTTIEYEQRENDHQCTSNTAEEQEEQSTNVTGKTDETEADKIEVQNEVVNIPVKSIESKNEIAPVAPEEALSVDEKSVPLSLTEDEQKGDSVDNEATVDTNIQRELSPVETEQKGDGDVPKKEVPKEGVKKSKVAKATANGTAIKKDVKSATKTSQIAKPKSPSRSPQNKGVAVNGTPKIATSTATAKRASLVEKKTTTTTAGTRTVTANSTAAKRTSLTSGATAKTRTAIAASGATTPSARVPRVATLTKKQPAAKPESATSETKAPTKARSSVFSRLSAPATPGRVRTRSNDSDEGKSSTPKATTRTTMTAAKTTPSVKRTSPVGSTTTAAPTRRTNPVAKTTAAATGTGTTRTSTAGRTTTKINGATTTTATGTTPVKRIVRKSPAITDTKKATSAATNGVSQTSKRIAAKTSATAGTVKRSTAGVVSKATVTGEKAATVKKSSVVSKAITKKAANDEKIKEATHIASENPKEEENHADESKEVNAMEEESNPTITEEEKNSIDDNTEEDEKIKTENEMEDVTEQVLGESSVDQDEEVAAITIQQEKTTECSLSVMDGKVSAGSAASRPKTPEVAQLRNKFEANTLSADDATASGKNDHTKDARARSPSNHVKDMISRFTA